MKNKNFSYILLGRTLFHTSKLLNRSHALRSVVELKVDKTFKEKWLDSDLRTSLEKYHKKFRSGDEINNDTLKEYELLIQGILLKLLRD